WTIDEVAVGRLRLPDAALHGMERYRVHPVILDACLQLVDPLLRAASGVRDDDTFLPVSIASLRVLGQPTREGMAAARLAARPVLRGDLETYETDVMFARADGVVILEASGVRWQRIASQTDRVADSCLFQ